MKTKELYYGRELFKQLKNHLPSSVVVAERLLPNGLIEISVSKMVEKQHVGIKPLIQIGGKSPIKVSDVQKLCDEAVKAMDKKIQEVKAALKKPKKDGKK